MNRTPLQAACGAVMDERAEIRRALLELSTGVMRFKDGSTPTPEQTQEFSRRFEHLLRENYAAYDWLDAFFWTKPDSAEAVREDALESAALACEAVRDESRNSLFRSAAAICAGMIRNMIGQPKPQAVYLVETSAFGAGLWVIESREEYEKRKAEGKNVRILYDVPQG